jgi:hypothetical protein
VSARVDDRGQLVDFELDGPREGSGRLWISVKVFRAQTSVVLRVETSARTWLTYETAPIVTRQDLAVLPERSSMGPRSHDELEFPRGFRRFLLFGFEKTHPPPRPFVPPPLEKRLEDRPWSAGVDLGIGVRQLRLPELDAALERDGFSTPSPTRGVAGFDIVAYLERFRFDLGCYGLGLATLRNSKGDEIHTSMSDVGLSAGYDVVREGGFAFYLQGGISAGSVDIDARAPGFTLFADQLAGTDIATAGYSWSALTAELGIVELVPWSFGQDSLSLAFGARLGFFRQIGADGWVGDGNPDRDLSGPPLDASGPRALITLGIHAVDLRPPPLSTLAPGPEAR